MSDADRLELVDASGPVAPRFAHRTRVVVGADGDGMRATREHHDTNGTTNDDRVLDPAAWRALVDAIARVVPPGTTLDLVGEKRERKGVSFNHVVLECGGLITRIDYLPSHVDEDDGDERVRAVVNAVRALFGS